MARRLPFTLATRSVPRIVIRPENTALLIQDMQHYFADKDGGYNSIAKARGVQQEYHDYFTQVPPITDNILRLVELAKRYDMPVIYTRFAYVDRSEISLLQRSLGIVLSDHDPQAQIISSLNPEPDDLVLTKTGLSAFSNPMFEEDLRIRPVENILVTGVMTEYGIRATAMAAMDHGFRPIVVSDGCAGITRETHGLATSDMTYGMMKVRNTGELLRYAKDLEFEDLVLI